MSLLYLAASAAAFGRLGSEFAFFFGIWALLATARMAWAFWKQRPQFLLKHVLMATLVVAVICSASRYIPAAAILIFLSLPAAHWAGRHPYQPVPPNEPLAPPLDPATADMPWYRTAVAKQVLMCLLVLGTGVIPLVAILQLDRTPIPAPMIPPIASPPPDPAPPGAGIPTAGNSVLVAVPPLKEVATFRRKVVFFAKDVDSPFLRLPEPGKRPQGFSLQVVPFTFRHGDSTIYSSVVMTNDGDLAFSTGKALYRTTKKGEAERLLGVSDVTMSFRDPLPAQLHFEQVLSASTTKPIVYVTLSSRPGLDAAPGPEPSQTYPSFVGRLDLASRQCSLIDESSDAIAIDPDAEVYYRTRNASVERVDFEENVEHKWPIQYYAGHCSLAPDRKSLRYSPFAMLDLTTGQETPLPTSGDAAVAAGDIIYFVRDTRRDGEIQETWLYRQQVGQNSPTPLFFVSRKLAKTACMQSSDPVLSADGTWLAWPLPLERPEASTLLLDLTNHEYRILRGRWLGVQCDAF